MKFSIIPPLCIDRFSMECCKFWSKILLWKKAESSEEAWQVLEEHFLLPLTSKILPLLLFFYSATIFKSNRLIFHSRKTRAQLMPLTFRNCDTFLFWETINAALRCTISQMGEKSVRLVSKCLQDKLSYEKCTVYKKIILAGVVFQKLCFSKSCPSLE